MIYLNKSLFHHIFYCGIGSATNDTIVATALICKINSVWFHVDIHHGLFYSIAFTNDTVDRVVLLFEFIADNCTGNICCSTFEIFEMARLQRSTTPAQLHANRGFVISRISLATMVYLQNVIAVR